MAFAFEKLLVHKKSVDFANAELERNVSRAMQSVD